MSDNPAVPSTPNGVTPEGQSPPSGGTVPPAQSPPAQSPPAQSPPWDSVAPPGPSTLYAAAPQGPSPQGIPPVAYPPRPTSSRKILGLRNLMLLAGGAIVVGLLWAVALTWADEYSDPAGPKATGDLHARQVVKDMCLESVGPDGAVSRVTVVECSQPHRGEVYFTMPVDLEVYPGEDSLMEQAVDTCAARTTQGLVVDWVAWIPSSSSWNRGDRTITCIAVSDEATTGTIFPSDDIGPDESDDAVAT